MKKLHLVVFSALVALLTGCATGYHSTGATGGFEQTRLSDRIFQVRFNGNGYTSQNLTSIFLLRRCAELTLEQGFRYFSLGQGGGKATSVSSAGGFLFSFPSGEAMVKTLDTKDEPNALDALFVIHDTERAAGGRLSVGAKAKLDAFENEETARARASGELASGTRLFAPDGSIVGTVTSVSGDSVRVAHRVGGEVVFTKAQAMQMLGKP